MQLLVIQFTIMMFHIGFTQAVLPTAANEILV